MAREVQRGANTVQGVEATLWQVFVTQQMIVLKILNVDFLPIFQLME